MTEPKHDHHHHHDHSAPDKEAWTEVVEEEPSVRHAEHDAQLKADGHTDHRGHDAHGHGGHGHGAS